MPKKIIDTIPPEIIQQYQDRMVSLAGLAAGPGFVMQKTENAQSAGFIG